jgi:hypothetical protein
VNEDGHPDLVVGSFMSSDGADEAGQIEIYSGADGSLVGWLLRYREQPNRFFSD